MVDSPTPDGIEQLCDRCMPGATRSRVGEWTLRAHLGATGRANSAWPNGAPGSAIGSAVDEVVSWYRGLGIRPAFQIFHGQSADLSAELDRRGWSSATGAEIMLSAIDALRLPNRSDHESRPTTIESRSGSAFARLVDEPDRLTELAESALPQAYAITMNPGGELVGGAMSMRDSDWLGVFAMKTVPKARRTGVATHLMGTLAERGRAQGASKLWLQVRPDNLPARHLYEALGFARVHGYHYRFLDH